MSPTSFSPPSLSPSPPPRQLPSPEAARTTTLSSHSKHPPQQPPPHSPNSTPVSPSFQTSSQHEQVTPSPDPKIDSPESVELTSASNKPPQIVHITPLAN